MSRDAYRSISGLAAVSAFAFTLGALVQNGVVRRLPDPPLRFVDSRRVMLSRAAFPFGVPDSPIALALEAAILAMAGTARRAAPARRRLLDRLIAIAATGGGIGAVRYLVEMVRLRRACVYCLGAATAMIALVPIAIKQARS